MGRWSGITTEQRFFEKVMPVPESGCWMWVGSDSGYEGYGSFQYKGRLTRAHRASYDMHIGPIPEGMTIDHLCKVKCCVNPAHLEAVSQKENNLRAHNCLSTINKMKTHCPKGHLYDRSNTRKWGNMRFCRACKNEAKRKANAMRPKHPLSEKTHCRRGHEFTPANTRIRVNGVRACRECAKAAFKRRYHMKKALKK